jgi:hypothetical protein
MEFWILLEPYVRGGATIFDETDFNLKESSLERRRR